MKYLIMISLYCACLTTFAQRATLSLENTGLRMDVHYGRTDAGTKIKVENNNDKNQPPYSKAQTFYVLSANFSEYIWSGYHEYVFIKSVLEGEARYVSVAGDNVTMGSKIELGKTEGANAQWDFVPAGEGYYYIKARKSFLGWRSLYINSSGKRGDQLFLGMTKQKWKLEPRLPNGYVELVVKLSDIKTPVHNNDCRKISGRFFTSLVNSKTKKIISSNTLNNGLVEWSNSGGAHESPKRTFTGRDFFPGEVRYIVNENDFLSGNLKLTITANNINRCHKSCDLCFDYNCDIYYTYINKNLSDRHYESTRPYFSRLTFYPDEKDSSNKHPIELTVNTYIQK